MDLIEFIHIVEVFVMPRVAHIIRRCVNPNVSVDACAHHIMQSLCWSVEFVFLFCHRFVKSIEFGRDDINSFIFLKDRISFLFHWHQTHTVLYYLRVENFPLLSFQLTTFTLLKTVLRFFFKLDLNIALKSLEHFFLFDFLFTFFLKKHLIFW